MREGAYRQREILFSHPPARADDRLSTRAAGEAPHGPASVDNGIIDPPKRGFPKKMLRASSANEPAS